MPITETEISYDKYHGFHLDVKRVINANKHITVDNFEDVEEPGLNDDDPNIPLQRREDQGRGDPEFNGKLENLSTVNKHLILETEDDDLIECTIQWLSVYNKTVQKKIMERVVKPETKDEEEEVEVEEEQQEPQEPTVPAPTSSEMECQTDESFLFGSKAGSSLQKEERVPPEGSFQQEGSGEPQAEQKDDIQKDDTAPKQEPAKRLYYGVNITGNEDDSAFRKLADCFTDGYHGEWAGFYNQGYPASVKKRPQSGKTMAKHHNHWFTNTDEQLMAEYIARQKDQLPPQELEELKNTCEHGCSDPSLHPRHQEHSEEAAKEAERRIDDDFHTLTKVFDCYVQDHGVLPYCVVLQCLASRYLGGGLLDPTYTDEEHPYRSSPQFSLMFWNLGNWCRKRFEKCPLPERLQKFAPHIDYNIDGEHNPTGDDKPQYNNYFINVIKNLGAHLFMNCEAGSLYPYRERLEEARPTTCFNDYHDLMVAARIDKEGYIRQIAAYNTSEDDTRIRAHPVSILGNL